MENFKTYVRKSPAELDSLWAEAEFTFDTNVLLNIYRRSPELINALFKTLTALQGRIFLTHHALLEFHRGRYDIIEDQIKENKQFLNEVKSLREKIQSKKQNPNFSEKLIAEIDDVITKMTTEINEANQAFKGLYDEDLKSKTFFDLFNNSFTQPFSDDELKNLFVEGKERYELRIPPGFADEKNPNKDEEMIYGDLIIWKHILRHAQGTNRPIILVTNDSKDDWTEKSKRHRVTIGPRRELIEEMQKEAGVQFHIYSFEEFLELGNRLLQLNTPKAIIDEAKEVNRTVPNWENVLEAFKNINWREVKRVNEIEFPNSNLTKFELDEKYSNLLETLQNKSSTSPNDTLVDVESIRDRLTQLDRELNIEGMRVDVLKTRIQISKIANPGSEYEPQRNLLTVELTDAEHDLRMKNLEAQRLRTKLARMSD